MNEVPYRRGCSIKGGAWEGHRTMGGACVGMGGAQNHGSGRACEGMGGACEGHERGMGGAWEGMRGALGGGGGGGGGGIGGVQHHGSMRAHYMTQNTVDCPIRPQLTCQSLHSNLFAKTSWCIHFEYHQFCFHMWSCG